MTDGLSRRGFMELTGAAGMAALSSSGVQPQVDGEQAERYGVLVGPRSARPSVDQLRSEWDTFQFVYLATDGGVFEATERDRGWRGPVSPRTNVRLVYDESDLPPVENGTHTLRDGVGYVPMGFITHEYPIELTGRSPLIGMHGGLDGFIYSGAGTGRGAAIQGTDANFFMRDLYLHAPGATLFDLTASQSEEMLVESYSTSDAAGFGNVADLGTVDGYRVITWKGVNMENFDAGLTFGTTNKIAIFDSPFRDVSASGVDIFTVPSTATIPFIDMAGSFVKDVQSDTVVWRIDSSSIPSGVLQIRGTLHDGSVTKSNVVVDESGTDLRENVGVNISDSFPLRDSTPGASLDYDGTGATTITGSGSGATEITAPSSTTNAERFTQQSDGILEYIGRQDATLLVVANASISGSNTQFTLGLAKNGLPAAGRTEVVGFTPNSTAPETLSLVGKLDLTTNDTVSLALENTGGSADLDVEAYSITV